MVLLVALALLLSEQFNSLAAMAEVQMARPLALLALVVAVQQARMVLAVLVGMQVPQ